MSTQEQPAEPTGEAFGLFAPPGGTDDPLSDEFGQEAPAPEVEAASAEPQVETEGAAPAEQAPEAQQGEQQPVEGEQQEPPPEQPERNYAGRYKSVEDLESGYKHIQRLATRSSEQARAQELKNQQLEAALQQAVGLLRQAGVMPDQQQPTQPQAPQQQQRQLPQQPQDLTPQAVQQFIEQQVAQRTDQVQAQAVQQLQAQQVSQTIDAFRQKHPDVAAGTELDNYVAEVVKEFQRDVETNRLDPSLFPVTLENLELAYELATQPQLYDLVMELDMEPDTTNIQLAKEALSDETLRTVLLGDPALIDSEHGVQLARRQAELLKLPLGAQQVAQAATQQVTMTPEQQRVAAHVETGGTGAPVTGAPGQRPEGDEFDEALTAWKGTGDSIWTGAKAT